MAKEPPKKEGKLLKADLVKPKPKVDNPKLKTKDMEKNKR